MRYITSLTTSLLLLATQICFADSTTTSPPAFCPSPDSLHYSAKNQYLGEISAEQNGIKFVSTLSTDQGVPRPNNIDPTAPGGQVGDAQFRAHYGFQSGNRMTCLYWYESWHGQVALILKSIVFMGSSR